MFFYIVSIAFYLYAMLNGFEEKGGKSRIITIIATGIAGINLYRIFVGTISERFFINLLLCIIPGFIFLVGLLYIFDQNKAEKNDKGDINIDSVKKIFNENIIDNEMHNKARSSYTDDTEKVTNNASEYEPIDYKNAKIEGYGSCDVEEFDNFIKITMRADGKEYEFYVKDANIVAFRVEGMGKPESY